MEWQPIETAPKQNGRPIDVWAYQFDRKTGEKKGRRFADAYWVEGNSGSGAVTLPLGGQAMGLGQTPQMSTLISQGWYNGSENILGQWNVTHWMPIPEPPSEARKKPVINLEERDDTD